MKIIRELITGNELTMLAKPTAQIVMWLTFHQTVTAEFNPLSFNTLERVPSLEHKMSLSNFHKDTMYTHEGVHSALAYNLSVAQENGRISCSLNSV